MDSKWISHCFSRKHLTMFHTSGFKAKSSSGIFFNLSKVIKAYFLLKQKTKNELSKGVEDEMFDKNCELARSTSTH